MFLRSLIHYEFRINNSNLKMADAKWRTDSQEMIVFAHKIDVKYILDS